MSRPHTHRWNATNSVHPGGERRSARKAPRDNALAQETTLSYIDMPVSQVLFRYLWPFWMFKDANRGDRMARAAAYRHNRGMRIYLPGYLLKWLVSCTVIFGLTELFNHLSSAVQGTLDIFVLMAAGFGMIFACGLCLIVITAYIYVYLSHHDYEC
jgi:hypothetical protein